MKINESIIVEEHFNVPVNIVWNAITNLDEMKQWYFNAIESFKPEIDFKTEFIVQSGERTFTHLWHIIKVEPLKRIVYNWKYKEYTGDSFVHFELFPQKNNTLLRVTTEITASFPKNISEFEIESGRQGWNYFIKNRLKNYLKKPE